MKNRLIGDRAFYRRILRVAVPIMIQNGITNFVALLDNIMIGQVGTEQMSGIAIVNQLITVFNISIFGAISGAGIFTAQFYGYKDEEGVRHSFRLKLYVCLAICLLGMLIFAFFGGGLISLFLHGEGNEAALSAALTYGRQYLLIMLAGFLPFCLEQVYTGTLRECGESFLPMLAGIIAVFVNLLLNWLLIFGSLGFPKLGVAGAAIATVISRYVQAAIVLVWTHQNTKRLHFVTGLYRSLKVPHRLSAKMLRTAGPLMVNEFLWAAGMAMLSQCYSLRGLTTVAAMNISNTIVNLFNVVFLALGNAISIIVGQLLGAGEMEEAKRTDDRMIFFATFSCVVLGILLFLLAPLFPRIYNTSEQVRDLASSLIRVAAVFLPVMAYMHAAYFTLRSGGRTIITFLFDSLFLIAVSVPAAFVLSRFTALTSVQLYFAVSSIDLIKCGIGFVLVKKGVWIRNLVGNT